MLQKTLMKIHDFNWLNNIWSFSYEIKSTQHWHKLVVLILITLSLGNSVEKRDGHTHLVN